MPWKVLVGLILCNLIWSAHPAMGKLVLADVSPALGAWLRYTSALLAYLLAVIALRRMPKIRSTLAGPFFLRPKRRVDWILVSTVGFMAFCFSPLLQMTGLDSSRATDNALIVAMEPLMTVVLARAFLGEKLARTHLIAFGIALTGFGLLTDLRGAGIGGDAHALGNLLMLVALTGEASYSIMGRKLLNRYAPLGIFGSALLIGVAFLTLFTLMAEGPQVFRGISHLSWKSILGLLWLGPLGTALAYFYWMRVLGEATVASLALTLFIQPVFGSVWGYLFLGERLSEVQSLGALLIIVAVLSQGLMEYWQAAFPPSISD